MAAERVKTAPKKPRFITVTFQTAKDGDQTENPSIFDHANIASSDYKTLYPLFTFDGSKEKEKFKSSVVDIQIKANFTENVFANTRAFALVIPDKMLSFRSDGNKMSVIY